MKKIILLFSLVVLFTTNVFSQGSYSIMGRSDYGITWAMVFEVEDAYNNMPLPGVTIELLDGRSKVAVIKTDSDGRAVILVNEVRYFESGMTLKAYRENYSGWTKQLGDQWDFISETKEKQFGLLPNDADYRRKGYLIDPESLDVSEVIPKILKGDFAYLKNASSGYGGTNYPGLFMYKFSLNYDRHPSERRRGDYPSTARERTSLSNQREKTYSSSQSSFSNVAEQYGFVLSREDLSTYIEIDYGGMEGSKVKFNKTGDNITLQIPVIIRTDDCDGRKENRYISLSGRKSGESLFLEGEFTMITKDCLGGEIGYEETKLTLQYIAEFNDWGIEGTLRCISNYRGVRGTRINYGDGTDHNLELLNLTINFQ